MSESSDHAAGNGDKAVNEAFEPSALDLPIVTAPHISGEDDEAQEYEAQRYEAQEYEARDEAADEAADEAEDQPVDDAASAAEAQAAPASSRRFLMLAATLAFAAAFGSFVGSVSGSGLVQFISPTRPIAATDNTIEATRQMKAELAEIDPIKTSLENAARASTSQYTKIADRLDQLDRRAGPTSAADVTGSLAGAAQSDQLPKIADRILQDWTVDDVQDGRALVESRYGGVFDVGAGSILPGLGRVDTIKRQDGHWVVLTARGTIMSGR
jgi:hypothetical protein